MDQIWSDPVQTYFFIKIFCNSRPRFLLAFTCCWSDDSRNRSSGSKEHKVWYGTHSISSTFSKQMWFSLMPNVSVYLVRTQVTPWCSYLLDLMELRGKRELLDDYMVHFWWSIVGLGQTYDDLTAHALNNMVALVAFCHSENTTSRHSMNYSMLPSKTYQ